MHYEKLTLKNGLRVILAPMKETQTVTMLVMTGVGSRYETRRENGLAHFLEHMFFKGTKRRPTTLDISKELDGIGAIYNAFTGKEYTGYYAKVEAHHWLTAVDVISDLFLNAKLEQAEIDRERGTILQEIDMYEDRPSSRVGEVFEELLYGDHPVGWRILGPKENIQRFKRADFMKYLRRGYVAENIVVGVSGNIDSKRVKEELEARFSEVASAKKLEFKRVKEKQSKPALAVRHKKTDQTHVVVGFRAFDAFHPDRYALSVLATILGGGMSSRLFVEVRERRGLAYDVHTGTDLYHDAGYIATQCGVEHGNLEKTVRVILDEHRKIAEGEVTEEEVRRAKEYIKGKMAMGFEGSDDVIEYLVSQEVLRDEIVSIRAKMDLVEKVTLDDVSRVAREVFRNDRLNMAVIGPHKVTKMLENLLKL